MKAHIQNTLLEANKDLPQTTFNLSDLLLNDSTTHLDELRAIFECSDESIVFNGFELSGLDSLFNDTSNSSQEFLGFDISNGNSIFSDSRNNSEFFGF